MDCVVHILKILFKHLQIVFRLVFAFLHLFHVLATLFPFVIKLGNPLAKEFRILAYKSAPVSHRKKFFQIQIYFVSIVRIAVHVFCNCGKVSLVHTFVHENVGTFLLKFGEKIRYLLYFFGAAFYFRTTFCIFFKTFAGFSHGFVGILEQLHY